MVTYIITRVTDPDGNDCTDALHTKRIGRRVSFYRQPAAGRSLLMDYVTDRGDGISALFLRGLSEVTPVPGGLRIAAHDGTYYFELAGHVGEQGLLSGQISIFDLAL